MKILLNGILKQVLTDRDAMYMARSLGYYMDEVTLTERDVVRASALYLQAKGHIPQRWSHVIKQMLRHHKEDDTGWMDDLHQMVSKAR